MPFYASGIVGRISLFPNSRPMVPLGSYDRGTVMASPILRAYKYRFYPTVEQKEQLAKTFGCTRFVYNHFLNLRSEAWREEKKRLSNGDCSKLLGELKREHEWLTEVSSVCLQQSLRHLDRAFGNFFQQRANYPQYKSKYRPQSATFMRNAFVYRNGHLSLAKHRQPLSIRWSRRFEGTPSSLVVSRDSTGRYFVSVLVEEAVAPLPFVKTSVGIDLGLSHEVVDSSGHAISRPGFLDNGLQRLKKLQRQLSHKRKGSKNRQKKKQQVARQHARIRDRRLDFLHKISRQLVNENQVIAAEDLDVRGMVKDRRLSRHIADAGWSTLLRFLEYKCRWYGREFVSVGRFFPSSKLCSGCGFKAEEMPLHQRQWVCPDCHSQHDRDHNAARNILKEGLRVLARESIVPWGTREFKPVECV